MKKILLLLLSITTIQGMQLRHPKKYMLGTSSLVNAEDLLIINDINQAGSEEQYLRTILAIDPENEVDQSMKDELEKMKKLHHRGEPITEKITLPPNGDCGALMQGKSDGACFLYSFLGAALQVPHFRKLCSKFIIREDEDNVYIKFALNNRRRLPQQLEKAFQTVYAVPKRLYHNKSNGKGLIPSKNPWVNLVSQAYFEHTMNIGLSNANNVQSYDLLFPNFDNNKVVLYEMLFGSKIKAFDLNEGCINSKNSINSTPCPIEVILNDENGNATFRNTSSRKEQTIDGTNKIFLVPAGRHARSVFYDETLKQWRIFDNQETNDKTCGASIKNSEGKNILDITQSIIIISAVPENIEIESP